MHVKAGNPIRVVEVAAAEGELALDCVCLLMPGSSGESASPKAPAPVGERGGIAEGDETGEGGGAQVPGVMVS